MSQIVYVNKNNTWYSLQKKYIEKIKSKKQYIHILFKKDYLPEIPDVKKHDHRYCMKVYEPEKNYRISLDSLERQGNLEANEKQDDKKEISKTNIHSNNTTSDSATTSNSSSTSSASAKKEEKKKKSTVLKLTPEELVENEKRLKDFAGIIFNDSVPKSKTPKTPTPASPRNKFIENYQFIDGIPIQKI